MLSCTQVFTKEKTKTAENQNMNTSCVHVRKGGKSYYDKLTSSYCLQQVLVD